MSTIRNTTRTRRSWRRAIRGAVLLTGLLGGVAALGASAVAASATPQTVTAGTVRAISSFYDPYTGDGSGGSLHVFSATASGVWETYWKNVGGAKTTGQINNLAGVTAISSFYDPYTADGSGGTLHVFSATPSGVWETYWDNVGGAKTTVKVNNLAGVRAISSFYDSYTGDGSGGSLHVFSATPSGDYETYWHNLPSGKTTGQINNL